MQQNGGGNMYFNDAKWFLSVAVVIVGALAIVYVPGFKDRLMRQKIRTHADKMYDIFDSLQTPVGLIIALLAIIIVGVTVNPLYALIIGILVLGVITNKPKTIVSPTPDIKENFQPSQSIRRVVPNRHMWFLEEIMNEDPYLIEEEIIRTSAVQDMSEKGVGSVQNSSVQNPSVQTF